MRRAVLLAAALAVFAASAQARIITYTFHQTSASIPGLEFTASYELSQGSKPLPADSNQAPPDFGGLVGLSVGSSGLPHSYPSLSLSDLIPSCQDPSGCVVIPPGCEPPDCTGTPYAYGFPDWQIDVPYLLYVYATDLDVDPFHIEWDYLLTATSIQVNDDNDANGCYDQYACYATGYWTPDYAPEPATLFALAGGLLLLASMRRRRSPSPRRRPRR